MGGGEWRGDGTVCGGGGGGEIIRNAALSPPYLVCIRLGSGVSHFC